ncbi:MAG: hypothetical protein ACPG4T_17350 [Nannocystaceae bacterium]
MSKDPSAIFRAENGDLERLSALETLKGLKSRDSVSLGDLVRFLESRGLWAQFRKITLGDLRTAFSPEPEPEPEPEPKQRRRKRRILEDELGDVEAKPKVKQVDDGGVSTDEVARNILPFIEGNGEVTLDDLDEYSPLDRKVLRHHLGVLVKGGRLERIGVGRHAVYSTLG